MHLNNLLAILRNCHFFFPLCFFIFSLSLLLMTLPLWQRNRKVKSSGHIFSDTEPNLSSKMWSVQADVCSSAGSAPQICCFPFELQLIQFHHLNACYNVCICCRNEESEPLLLCIIVCYMTNCWSALFYLLLKTDL